MNIRSFQLSDYAHVNQLLKRVLSESCYAETIEALARQLSYDSGLVLVAQAEERIAGILIGTVDRHQGYFYRIAVDPHHRGKGIAKALIAEMRQRFMKRNVRHVFVALDHHNRPLMPLYESLGLPVWENIHQLKIVSGT